MEHYLEVSYDDLVMEFHFKKYLRFPIMICLMEI